MKVAVVGSGGREHALIKKIKESPMCGPVVAIPGNGGISEIAECIPLKATDIEGIVEYCASNNVEYVVVAPDDPLALGLVDALEAKGILAFGPCKRAAQIEASKAFAKNMMKKHNIPTANFEVFGDSASALAFVERQTKYPIVVKADGLALGKGVLICTSKTEAHNAILQIMEEGAFGGAGSRVVIEEFMTGPEVSVLAFCDGEKVVPMVSGMDHKRALDGDKGKNTGGMGVVAPNPCYTKEMAARCMEEIFKPTMRAMAEEGAPFKGCLYFGLMLTPDGPRVVEYNCRFGDPETQAIVPLMQFDLLDIMVKCTNGTLDANEVMFANKACANIVLASGGYPEHYETGFAIQGIAAVEALLDVFIYHAGTKKSGETYYTAGGRVLSVSAVADTLPKAIERAYAAAAGISFEGAHYRKDIGSAALSLIKTANNSKYK